MTKSSSTKRVHRPTTTQLTANLSHMCGRIGTSCARNSLRQNSKLKSCGRLCYLNGIDVNDLRSTTTRPCNLSFYHDLGADKYEPRVKPCHLLRNYVGLNIPSFYFCGFNMDRVPSDRLGGWAGFLPVTCPHCFFLVVSCVVLVAHTRPTVLCLFDCCMCLFFNKHQFNQFS